jgi:chaperone required for assembly of F1-ATPase
VRNAAKEIVHVPLTKPNLATAMAMEWDSLTSAQQAFRTHFIPLTSLVSRAIDIADADRHSSHHSHNHPSSVRSAIVAMCMRILSTDTLLCWAPARGRYDPTGADDGRVSLRDTQRAAAEAVLGPLLTREVWGDGVSVVPVLDEGDSILPRAQEKATTEAVRAWCEGLDAWDLAGLERAVLATKSLCVGARLVAEWSEELGVLGSGSGSGAEQRRLRREEEVFGVEQATEAATVEVRWQTGNWGEVDDTHDVEKEDLRRQLGSVVLLVSGTKGR